MYHGFEVGLDISICKRHLFECNLFNESNYLLFIFYYINYLVKRLLRGCFTQQNPKTF